MHTNVNETAKSEHARKSGEVIEYAVGNYALGTVLVARSDKGLCAVLLGDNPGELELDLLDRFPNARLMECDAEFEKLVGNVIKFVEDPSCDLVVPLDERGTDFQRRVWKALREIPVGSTASYTDVAGKIGFPKSARAVGQACAANPLAVVIPCHRVVRSDGALSGYRWGLELKKSLLQREAAKCLSKTPYGTKQKHKTEGNV